MKYKIIETWVGINGQRNEPMDFVDIDDKVYYAKETRFCSKKAAEKFMEKWRPNYTFDYGDDNSTLQVETNQTLEKGGYGFIYEAVLE